MPTPLHSISQKDLDAQLEVCFGDESITKRGTHHPQNLEGGMRQTGILAGSGLYALQNHVEGSVKTIDMQKKCTCTQ